ncbi:MAG: hypothetical protein DI598_15215 [Pseudopedobacter saltans]|uniref:Uncharacterized protein n=1 Tax=Pseudopedobacter saltans TaxID=151895 RepID=A0A2W5GKS3_9SPHI|nr:MAG: hypothetical protein DI598_15215 [Pseudopedobacter saltans]
MKRHVAVSVIACFLLDFYGCGKPMNISSLSIGEDYCQPNTYYENKNLKRFSQEEVTRLQSQLNHYTPHNLYTANAAGILPLLLQMGSIDTSNTSQKNALQLKALLAIQQLNEEIDGVAATLDCEGEKTDQVANYLDNINQKRNNQLTITSIIVGALTTIATVAIQKNSVQNTVAIGGGILGGGIAALMINPAGKKIKWPQNKNLLGSVWYADNAANMIPSAIWYMLNEKSFSNSQKISLIESIKKRWMTINFQDDLSPEDENKFFKNGGTFTSEDLHLRANMLNELQATVRSLHQDLASLTNNISQMN